MLELLLAEITGLDAWESNEFDAFEILFSKSVPMFVKKLLNSSAIFCLIKNAGFLDSIFTILISAIKTKLKKRISFHNTWESNFYTAQIVTNDWLKSFDFIIQTKTTAKNGYCLVV